MENMDKKEAAFKVAARHHDFLEKATHKYMELTGQVSEEFRQKLNEMCNECLQNYQPVNDKEFTCEDIRSIVDCIYPSEITCDNSFRAAQEEMLGLLPGCRHPVEKRIIEYEIFFGSTGWNTPRFPIVSPSWAKDEHIINLPHPLRNTVQEYAMDAELDKYYLRKEREENAELKKQLVKAREAYKKIKNDDSHKRNARVVKALGLSSGKKGNRQSIDHRGAYEEYVWLVRKEGESREESLEIVQQEFGYNGVDGARASLYDELHKVKEWWPGRNDLDSVLYTLYEKSKRLNEFWQPEKNKLDILTTYWKALIPSKKP